MAEKTQKKNFKTKLTDLFKGKSKKPNKGKKERLSYGAVPYETLYHGSAENIQGLSLSPKHNFDRNDHASENVVANDNDGDGPLDFSFNTLHENSIQTRAPDSDNTAFTDNSTSNFEQLQPNEDILPGVGNLRKSEFSHSTSGFEIQQESTESNKGKLALHSKYASMSDISKGVLCGINDEANASPRKPRHSVSSLQSIPLTGSIQSELDKACKKYVSQQNRSSGNLSLKLKFTVSSSNIVYEIDDIEYDKNRAAGSGSSSGTLRGSDSLAGSDPVVNDIDSPVDLSVRGSNLKDIVKYRSETNINDVPIEEVGKLHLSPCNPEECAVPQEEPLDLSIKKNKSRSLHNINYATTVTEVRPKISYRPNSLRGPKPYEPLDERMQKLEAAWVFSNRF